ncbi:MAG TPA: DUF192 domain-containing protein [Rhizomicrobium sp.]|jgi:hypothetical protein
MKNVCLAALAVAFVVAVSKADAAIPKANAPLPVTSVVIDSGHGAVRFTTEIAGDPASQERGLMFRTKLAPNAGMLFDFHTPAFQTFWMKNTILPLDMLFIRADGTISSIAQEATPYSETPIPSYERVRAVLEINGGRAAALGIEPGQRVHNAIFGNALPGQK